MASTVPAANALLLEGFGHPELKNALNSLYNEFATNDWGSLKTEDLQQIYQRLRESTLSIPQIEASMRYVCSGYPQILECDEEELVDVLREMDRRCFLANDLQWDFRMLDRTGKGSIPVKDAMFLFKMTHGEFFCLEHFNDMIARRMIPESDITFEEIEVDLCNIPTYEWIEQQMAAERKLKEIELEKEKEQAEFERLKREAERLIEEKRKKDADAQRLREEEEKRLEAKKRLEEEKILEEEKNQREEAKARKEKEEQDRKLEEENLRREEELRKALEEKRKQDELEEKAAEKRKVQEEEMRIAAQAARLQEEKDAEEARRREEEQAMILQKQKEQEEGELRLKEMERKLKEDEEARLKEEENERKAATEAEVSAETIGKAEEMAEEELRKAENELKAAISKEEKEKAIAAKEKAAAEALRNKEKRLRLQLTAAVKLRNRPKLVVTINEAKESKIKELKPDISMAEKILESLKYGEDLEDAMAQRDMAKIEEAKNSIENNGFEKEHALKILEANKLLEKLRRLEKSKRAILELNQRTIAEIRSYQKPLPAIHDVMIGTYMVLGYKEKELQGWKFIQALLGRTGKEGLKRMCTTLDASKIDLSIAKAAEKRYFDKHSLDSVTDISAGVGTFYAWSTTMIEEKRNWMEDGEFRKALEEKRKKEEEETRKLQKTLKKK